MTAFASRPFPAATLALALFSLEAPLGFFAKVTVFISGVASEGVTAAVLVFVGSYLGVVSISG